MLQLQLRKKIVLKKKKTFLFCIKEILDNFSFHFLQMEFCLLLLMTKQTSFIGNEIK